MTTTTVDGRSIAYDHIAGSGEPLVFVHGWTCARWAFVPQYHHFMARGHTVVSLDLPGHGASDPIGTPIGVDTLANAVLGVMAATGTEGAVVIGHSMGGLTALDMAARRPDSVKAVVAVDPAPMTAKFSDDPARAGANAAFEDEASRMPVFMAFVNSFFHPVAAEGIKKLVQAEMGGASDDARMHCWRAMYDHDGPATLAAVTRPVLHIAATPPLNPVDTFASMLADCTTGQTVGSGHFCHLEVPEQVNSMIERFLVALAARS